MKFARSSGNDPNRKKKIRKLKNIRFFVLDFVHCRYVLEKRDYIFENLRRNKYGVFHPSNIPAAFNN